MLYVRKPAPWEEWQKMVDENRETIINHMAQEALDNGDYWALAVSVAEDNFEDLDNEAIQEYLVDIGVLGKEYSRWNRK